MTRSSTDLRHWRWRAALALPALLALAAVVAPRILAAPATRVANPHGALKEECATCHSASGWKPARVSRRFDHARYGFALEGAHAAVECMACHGSLDFSQQKTLCASCHQDPHRGEMGTDCARCHGARSFIDRSSMLRAHQLTHLPLTGSHAGLDCEACHRPAAQGQMQFVGTRAECIACHEADFRAARNPDHTPFPQDCMSCHSTLGWNSARFDHARTSFPLTGAHTRAACASCQGDGVYAGKNTACVSCHRPDYDGTTNPNHAAAGYSTSCQTCHNTTAWAGAGFDHNQTAFPLTGAHAGAACASCHGDGVYAGKSTACASCHQSNYDGTTDPQHAAAGFPLTCGTCHNTTSWSGARFTSHDASFFPIYSGTHSGRWSNCSTCHTTNTNYANFTCFSCHPHDDQATTTLKHSAVSGFSYDSQACYSCHPRGVH